MAGWNDSQAGPNGVPDWLRQSALTGLAHRTLAVRQQHYTVWDGCRNARGDSFACELVVSGDPVPEAECRWTPQGALITITNGMTGLAEQLFLAVTGLMAVGETGEFVMRPYEDHAAGKRTPEDLMLAAFLIDQAIGFVADHEFVHAVNGHVLLVANGSWRDRSTATEADLYRAMELEADRSALFCLVDDLREGRAPTNDLVDRLSLADRLTLIGLAVAAMCAVWLAAEEADGASTFHPPALARLYMLIGPSLVRALARAGVPDATITQVHRQLGHLLVELGARSRRLAPLAGLMAVEAEAALRAENERLEVIYASAVAPALAALHFAPTGSGR